SLAADRLLLEVLDTGIGLPTDESSMFGLFVQGDGSTRRRFGGTGLGLAVASRWANLLGAELGAERRAGGGSRFWCSLPVEHPSGRRAHPDLCGHKVLLVEPNASSYAAISRQLQAW